MRIVQVDPTDNVTFEAWHRAFDEGASAGRQDPPIWALKELRETYLDADSSWAREAWAAIHDGTVIGAAQLELPIKDNQDLAEVGVFVPPAQRQHGVGSALYDTLIERIQQLGRSRVGAGIDQPAGTEQVPGVAFAVKRGFTKRNVEMRRVISLPVPTDVLDSIESESLPYSQGYSLKSWIGPCPTEYEEQYAELKSLLSVEAPLGEVQYEKEVWDVERLRSEERLTANQQRIVFTTVAINADNQLAGHTQAVAAGHEPGKAYQWDTLVLSEHRGHRLGNLLKVANHRLFNKECPDRDRMETWNATQNDHMNAINDRLGYQDLEEYQEWQLDL